LHKIFLDILTFVDVAEVIWCEIKLFQVAK